ncbi:hypothetical protein [Streptomyces sp. NBC_00996]|uniref:hypothetical protein n=1 Tax=Streptomyces sp. NBC_00996 TaxID=2903710 RepID=UPI00386DEAB8|nr:hypothetical protein OG390_17755 [Streptomyces sp. NBC_00996]
MLFPREADEGFVADHDAGDHSAADHEGRHRGREAPELREEQHQQQDQGRRDEQTPFPGQVSYV